MKNDLYDDISVNYLYNVHIWNLKYIHTYLYFKGSPYGAAPLITPFCIPEKVVVYLNFV